MASYIAVIPILCTVVHCTMVLAEQCDELGKICVSPQRCCGQTCCIPTELEHHYHVTFRWSVWNMWYFWFIVIFILMTCFGGCRYYRRRQLLLAQQQGIMGDADFGFAGTPQMGLHRPRLSRLLPTFPIPIFARYNSAYSDTQPPIPRDGANPQGSFPEPPPYAEVISKPDVYPVGKVYLPPYPGNSHSMVPGLQAGYPDFGPAPRPEGAIGVMGASPAPPYTPQAGQGEAVVMSAIPMVTQGPQVGVATTTPTTFPSEGQQQQVFASAIRPPIDALPPAQPSVNPDLGVHCGHDSHSQPDGAILSGLQDAVDNEDTDSTPCDESSS